MYLDGSWSGGEGDEGTGRLVAYGWGGGVEEIVDATDEPAALSGVRMTHLWDDNDTSMNILTSEGVT